MARPLEAHWVAVKRILRYLKGTFTHGLHLLPIPTNIAPTIQVLCDANWDSNPYDRWSKKQPVVSRPNTQSKFISIAQATTDLLWVQTLLKELFISTKVPQILCDNQSTTLFAHNPLMHTKTKHMEIVIFFVREKVMAKQVQVLHVTGTDQWANVLTKPLASTDFISLRHKLRVVTST
ncbi:hypothetical protein KIW84_042972 [Lathyrus oleraceus]|uniref:Copia protein n=1 Tax=Pisum sativum TaxID=3888 RepID=A0A9D4XDT9_PEA|nr:hypothetical protein KIW84_042972 [Pisum sativum]